MIGVVDIGGTKIATGIVDDQHLRERREIPTGDFARSVEQIVCMLQESTRGAKLEGIGIASTGPIDRRTGEFGQVDTLPNWKGNALVPPIRAAFGDVPITIENDADAAALGEAVHGAGRNAARFLFVTISTGIGGGAIVDGRIYRGAGGAHPEFGHHMIEASGPFCPCGGRGCWELLASGPAMARGTEHTAAEICARAEEPWARAIVEREARYIGVGLANLVAMFAPDMIALGGGVMKSAHLFLEPVRAIVRTSCTLVPAPEIVLATLGADAGLIGAAQAMVNHA
jgi:glucokinase